jgi:hypothetical protein
MLKSNENKTQNKVKITLNIFKKVTSLHIKKSINTFLALTNSKIKIFSKFSKQLMSDD